MQKLIQGLHQFQNNLFSSQRELFERLAKGQQPDALFLTCSDSRINPNLITQTDPGELFIVRNAGNIVPPHQLDAHGEEATIEFAINGLGIKDIIICGHSHCGAVKALLDTDGIRDSMPALCSWLKHADSARRNVEAKYQGLGQEERLNVAIQENVLAQLENLRSHPAVAKAIERSALNLHGWVYKFETGQIFGYDPQQGQFVIVEETAVVQEIADSKRVATHLCAI